MKKLIPQYTFYKNKYGSELLVDVVDLKYVKPFLAKSPAHTLTYYDITFITEGQGSFSIDNHAERVAPGDVVFSKPGEVRHWDVCGISNGYALIFEDEFLSSFFKDPMFVRHLSFFMPERTASTLHLPDSLYGRLIQLLKDIKGEIGVYKQNDDHLLRALLYEALMLLNRAYRDGVQAEGQPRDKGVGNIYINKFMELVDKHLKEQHSVRFYADRLCITPNYLNEIVRSVMGIGAKQYILNKVMDEAKRLLAYTGLPVADIALQLHFSTVSYFVRSFRQTVGGTPLAYRAAHKP